MEQLLGKSAEKKAKKKKSLSSPISGGLSQSLEKPPLPGLGAKPLERKPLPGISALASLSDHSHVGQRSLAAPLSAESKDSKDEGPTSLLSGPSTTRTGAKSKLLAAVRAPSPHAETDSDSDRERTTARQREKEKKERSRARSRDDDEADGRDIDDRDVVVRNSSRGRERGRESEPDSKAVTDHSPAEQATRFSCSSSSPSTSSSS